MSMRSESLSNADYKRISELIYEECGINLNAEKKIMIEIRLRQRLRSLEMSSYSEYCDYALADGSKAQELVHLIDVVTTNKTDFFRESGHFDFLVSHALPELASRIGMSRRSFLWSAGCSTGEEPYTLAMVMSEYAEANTGFQYKVLASDICTDVLAKATMGIFKKEVLNPVPQNLRRKYFMRSRDHQSDLHRVVPELRAQVAFQRINLMDPDFGIDEAPEIIFCRNVIIYFDRETQTKILKKLTRKLAPGGYFFAGHSESLQGMDLPVVAVGQSVYRKAM
jgi:chemotaxis protein methyltransferase CheR